MRAFSTLVLGAVLFASQNNSAEAFSPSARAKVLTDLKEMRMSGAGGAASPDYYVEGTRVCHLLLQHIYIIVAVFVAGFSFHTHITREWFVLVID